MVVPRFRFKCFASDFLILTHSFIDLLAIAPIFRREHHSRLVDISIDHQQTLVRLSGHALD
jgi:hypothetical protein